MSGAVRGDAVFISGHFLAARSLKG